jgi:hypothetical protein
MKWEIYYKTALEELEIFRSEVIDPACRDAFHAKVGASILMAIAQCEPAHGMGKNISQAMVLHSLENRCRNRAETEIPE